MIKPRHLGLLGAVATASVLALILFISFPSSPDPKCAALLARPENVPKRVITPVAVEKLEISEIRTNLGDRKCLGDPRKSFVGHPDAI